MSIALMTAAWALDLPTGEKIVLLSLADNANDAGHCWPSMAQIAKRAGMTTRGAQLIIQRLVAAGHLTRAEVPGKGCNYRVHPRTTFTPELASPANETADTPERRSDKSSRTTSKKIKATPSSSPRVLAIVGDFDAFWLAYPRKVGRGAAERAYLKVCRVVPPDKILAAAHAYAASRADEDPQFTAHPTTWLNQGRYDDQIEGPFNANPAAQNRQSGAGRNPARRGDGFATALGADLADIGRRRAAVRDDGSTGGDPEPTQRSAPIRLAFSGPSYA